MNRPEVTTIKLTKKWCGQPAGLEMTLIKVKADDLVNRGYAEEIDVKPKSKPRTRKPAGTKNRAIQTSSNE